MFKDFRTELRDSKSNSLCPLRSVVLEDKKDKQITTESTESTGRKDSKLAESIVAGNKKFVRKAKAIPGVSG